MADIFKTTDHDPYGEIEYGVEWQDNDGIVRERYFKSKRAAERFAVDIEVLLLDEVVQSIVADSRSGSSGRI